MSPFEPFIMIFTLGWNSIERESCYYIDYDEVEIYLQIIIKIESSFYKKTDFGESSILLDSGKIKQP